QRRRGRRPRSRGRRGPARLPPPPVPRAQRPLRPGPRRLISRRRPPPECPDDSPTLLLTHHQGPPRVVDEATTCSSPTPEENTMSQLNGLVPGSWTFDPAHSEVGFTVRHAGISKV